MNEDPLGRSIAERARLRTMTLRLQQQVAPTYMEVQEALEQRFACLVSLEAEARRAGDEKPALAAEASALHAALTELRELSGTRAGSWRTRGFVLSCGWVSPDGVRSGGAERETQQPGR